MGRHSPPVAIAGFALLVLTSSCAQNPVQPVSQSPANPAPPDTVTPFATVSRTDLGTLGGASTAADIDDAGVVVGWSQTAAGVDHAFRWTEAQGVIDLGTLPGDQWSRALSITRTGRILGLSGRTGAAGTPVVWDSGTVTILPIPFVPGAAAMIPSDGNAVGQVIGLDPGSTKGWIWSETTGTYAIGSHISSYGETYVSELNETGLVVGTNWATSCSPHQGGEPPECWRAFVWGFQAGYRELGVPTDDRSSRTRVMGSAINEQGIVVGSLASGSGYGPVQPYQWSDRTGFTLLPTFSPEPNNYGYAQSVNAAGTAVGASKDAQVGAIQAAAWPKAGGIVKLSPDDSHASVAVAVNASGTAVGWTTVGTTNHATLWKLSPGRGASTPPLADLSRSPIHATAIQSGPTGCLSDARAVMSRQLLIDCVVQREH